MRHRTNCRGRTTNSSVTVTVTVIVYVASCYHCMVKQRFLKYSVPPCDSTIESTSFVVMYADDIGLLLIAPSVNELQRLFQASECERNNLDMCINVKKSCCIRIGRGMILGALT